MKPIIKVPAGVYYSAVEGSRGEFGALLVSKGDKSPYRLHYRSTGLPLVAVMDHACRGNMIADLITIEEHKQVKRPKVVLTWAPHCRALPQAVPNSFAEWMNAADVDLVVTHPEGYELDSQFVGNAIVEYNQKKALEGADFVYAKNWSCPGVTRPEDYGKILCKDMSWTIDSEHMSWTNNGKFMHCLPVRRGLIVSDDVIESANSLVIPEEEKREREGEGGRKRGFLYTSDAADERPRGEHGGRRSMKKKKKETDSEREKKKKRKEKGKEGEGERKR